MHVRVWRWRRLGHVCGVCGLRWRRGAERCIDEPTPQRGQVRTFEPPTDLFGQVFLTHAQMWRGNGGK